MGKKRLSKACLPSYSESVNCWGFPVCSEIFHCCTLWIQHKHTCSRRWWPEWELPFLPHSCPAPAQPPRGVPTAWAQSAPAAGMLFLLFPASLKSQLPCFHSTITCQLLPLCIAFPQSLHWLLWKIDILKNTEMPMKLARIMIWASCSTCIWAWAGLSSWVRSGGDWTPHS